jgi:membrane protein
MQLSGRSIAEEPLEAANRVAVPIGSKLPLATLLGRLLEQLRTKHVAAYAGNIAFRGLFAVFPSLISLLWLLRALHATPLVNALVGLVATALPDAASGVLRHQLTALPSGHASAGLTGGAAISMIVALWAASAAFRATTEALNVLHPVDEAQPSWLRYLLSPLLAITMTILLVSALALVVLGSAIVQKLAQATGVVSAFRAMWLGITWLILLALALCAFELVYYAASNFKEPFRWVSRGSLVGLVLWTFFTLAFTFYINHVTNYTESYGALAGVAVLMIYVYAVSFILLLGAAINRTLEGNDAKDRRSVGQLNSNGDRRTQSSRG